MFVDFQNKKIPILDTAQLEKVLLDVGVPVSNLNRSAYQFFHINRLEDYHKIADFEPKSDSLPRRINIYSFFFLTKGKSIRSNGLDTYEFGENEFYFIPAHQITVFNTSLKYVEGYYCHFNLDLLCEKQSPETLISEFPFLEFNGYPLVKVNEQTLKNLKPLFERLLQEYNEEKANKTILGMYLKVLFTELKPFVEVSKPMVTNASGALTEKYKKALVTHILKKMKISEYAELLNVSPNHLNKCVKLATNKSAHVLLEEMILVEAKVLLKQSDFSITDIAFKIGRNDLSDFSRFFKAKTGKSPSEYRFEEI